MEPRPLQGGSTPGAGPNGSASASHGLSHYLLVLNPQDQRYDCFHQEADDKLEQKRRLCPVGERFEEVLSAVDGNFVLRRRLRLGELT